VLPFAAMRSAYEVRFVGPPGWRRMPPVTRGTLVLTAFGYLGTLLVRGWAGWLTAVPERIWPGLELWRLVTYPVVNVGIVSLLFGLLLLWSFGSELEPEWGSRGYALFLVLATISGGALGAGTALLLGESFGAGFGLAGPVTAVIAAWTLEGPSRPTNFFGILPMTRLVFGVLAVLVVAFGELEQTHSLARLVFVLGGLPVAWLWGRRRPPGAPRSPRIPRLFRRRRFRVVSGDDLRVH
jgi:membrane associated rhomboid family serine protease